MGRAGRRLNAEHDAELAAIDEAAAGDAATTQLLLGLRAFGRIPKHVQGGDPQKAAERSFANRFQRREHGGASPPSTRLSWRPCSISWCKETTS